MARVRLGVQVTSPGGAVQEAIIDPKRDEFDGTVTDTGEGTQFGRLVVQIDAAGRAIEECLEQHPAVATTLRPDPTIKLPVLVTHNKCLTLNIPTQTPAVRRWLPCTAGDFVAVGTVLNLLIVTEEDGARHGCRNRTGVSVACHEPYVADALTEQQQQQPLPDHTVCDTGVAVVRADMRTGVTGSLFKVLAGGACHDKRDLLARA